MTMAAGQLRTNEVAYENDYREKLERDHHGKTALMHDGNVVDIYDDPNDAYVAGYERWGLGSFSMKEIGREPIELGIFSASLA